VRATNHEAPASVTTRQGLKPQAIIPPRSSPVNTASQVFSEAATQTPTNLAEQVEALASEPLRPCLRAALSWRYDLSAGTMVGVADLCRFVATELAAILPDGDAETFGLTLLQAWREQAGIGRGGKQVNPHGRRSKLPRVWRWARDLKAAGELRRFGCKGTIAESCLCSELCPRRQQFSTENPDTTWHLANEFEASGWPKLLPLETAALYRGLLEISCERDFDVTRPLFTSYRQLARQTGLDLILLDPTNEAGVLVGGGRKIKRALLTLRDLGLAEVVIGSQGSRGKWATSVRFITPLPTCDDAAAALVNALQKRLSHRQGTYNTGPSGGTDCVAGSSPRMGRPVLQVPRMGRPVLQVGGGDGPEQPGGPEAAAATGAGVAPVTGGAGAADAQGLQDNGPVAAYSGLPPAGQGVGSQAAAETHRGPGNGRGGNAKEAALIALGKRPEGMSDEAFANERKRLLLRQAQALKTDTSS